MWGTGSAATATRSVDQSKAVTQVALAEKPWMDVKDVAEYLDLSPKKVYQLCATGGLKHSKVGSQIRVKQQWVDEWMEAHAVTWGGRSAVCP